MPYAVYRGLGDGDLMAMVAFLRTLPAIENEVPESQYRIALPPAWGPPVWSVTAPERGVSAEYGAYLAGPVAPPCTKCHTPMGPQGPMLDTALGQGGFAFQGRWGVSVAANLTSRDDGLAGYSEIKAMIVEGVHPDGRQMMPPMPYGIPGADERGRPRGDRRLPAHAAAAA